MAPFIVNHPTLLHKWIYCREKALKEIKQEHYNRFTRKKRNKRK